MMVILVSKIIMILTILAQWSRLSWYDWSLVGSCQWESPGQWDSERVSFVMMMMMTMMMMIVSDQTCCHLDNCFIQCTAKGSPTHIHAQAFGHCLNSFCTPPPPAHSNGHSPKKVPNTIRARVETPPLTGNAQMPAAWIWVELPKHGRFNPQVHGRHTWRSGSDRDLGRRRLRQGRAGQGDDAFGCFMMIMMIMMIMMARPRECKLKYVSEICKIC